MVIRVGPGEGKAVAAVQRGKVDTPDQRFNLHARLHPHYRIAGPVDIIGGAVRRLLTVEDKKGWLPD